MEPAGPFPLLVEGPWGPQPPKKLRTKLHLYFQSARRSGGGECTLLLQPGDPPTLLLLFAHHHVRSRVLQQAKHEAQLLDAEPVRFSVRLPDHHGETPAQETEPDVATPNPDAPRVPQGGRHVVGGVEPPEPPEPGVPRSVALMDVPEEARPEYLAMLVERYSGLNDEADFSLEVLPQLRVAVVTFQDGTGVEEFARNFNERKKNRNQMTARALEPLDSVMVEDLPPGSFDDYLAVYFESPKNGGGSVTGVTLDPEENSAVVTFSDPRVLPAVLAKEHFINKRAVSVHAYCRALGATLYGKERPPPRPPAPLTVPVCPDVWRLLHHDARRVAAELEEEMRAHLCLLEWAPPDGARPEVTLRPSPALAGEGASKIGGWREAATAALGDLLDRFRAARLAVTPAAWAAVGARLKAEGILTVHDPKGQEVTLVGRRADVDRLEPEWRALVDREQRSLAETVAVPAAQLGLLRRGGLEEEIRAASPDLRVSFEAGRVALTGLEAEVFRAKCRILERLRGLARGPLPLRPAVVRFLRRVDGAALSRALFDPPGISAVCELDGEAAVLTASSPEALEAAREEVRRRVGSRPIPVADPAILALPGWRELVRRLPGPDSPSPVLVDDPPEGPGAEVVVTGLSPALEEAYGPLADFADGHAPDRRLVPVGPLATLRYLEQAEDALWKGLTGDGLTVVFVPDVGRRGVSLSGPRMAVAAGLPRVRKAAAMVAFSEVAVEKPGVGRLFRDQEPLYAAVVKQQFGCLIRLLEDGEDGEEDGGPGPVLCLKELPGGVELVVRRGDLARYPASAVVNPANENLEHVGGLAGHLARRAGPELQEACRLLVKESGPVPTGRAVATEAWSLPYGHIIHAVGPRWRPDDPKGCAALLGRAVRESLRLADRHGHGSVAIPAVGAGVFGFPAASCADAIVEAVAEAARGGLRAVRAVHLVDLSEDTARALAEAAGRAPGAAVAAPVAGPEQKAPREGPPVVLSTLHTRQGLKVVLESGRIEDATTQVIINSVAPDLQLGKGALAAALLRAAGPEIQVQLDRHRSGGEAAQGSVFTTSGGKLGCSIVLHVVIPQWDNGAGMAEQLLKDVVEKCLEITERRRFQSVTFPAIGSGNLCYPPAVVARTMVEAVNQFSQLKQPLSVLSRVHIVVFPQNKDSIQAFSSEFNSRKGSAAPKPQTAPKPLKIPSNPDRVGIPAVEIGPVRLEVTCGDITREDGDAVVNITNTTLTLRRGVSKAIMEAAGQDIVDICAQLGARANRRSVVTSGGALPCKHIIHVVTQEDVKAMVTCALQKCAGQNFSSVAFPAIGTGAAQLNPEEAANSMIGAIFQFIEAHRPQALKRVKIVIFQPHLQPIFHAALKKQTRAPKSSEPEAPKLRTKLRALFRSKRPQKAASKKEGLLQKEVKGSVFHICGPAKDQVDAAASWLQDLILKESWETTISDPLLPEIGDREVAALEQLREFHRVQVMEDNPTTLRVSGLTRDVGVVFNRIQELLRELRTAREEEEKAERCSKSVRWQWCQRGQPVPFDRLTNLALETALEEGKVITLLINQKEHQVDFTTMQVTDPQGNSFPLQRVPLQEGKRIFEFPREWEDMKEQDVKVVQLDEGSREYQDVQAKFLQTCSMFRIVTIERIQNRYLWQSYLVKKESMDTRKAGASNERRLFHGTAHDKIDHINKWGFNRSYAGLNAAYYGNGTYFAVNARYSADNKYSKPDALGVKFVYLARVLTGEFCLGRQGLITPPPKNPQDPTDLFDSVSDHLTNPAMFVVFSDNQAYPEYLISFSR
ncbi:protein mono-ADP-ribosyltransferase PARP14-like [Tachyglossus aculeatus]|uniref:protein mono-ADP-ribosyltransferase PARP14-like n=1 Tax=Tachyglossus aculeatus TaxID=9261 RepID=UPI0018F7315E|nr:protein mono-ADP-ribosyltransferase PARP14-like [Tachyglossus aculeatus]